MMISWFDLTLSLFLTGLWILGSLLLFELGIRYWSKVSVDRTPKQLNLFGETYDFRLYSDQLRSRLLPFLLIGGLLTFTGSGALVMSSLWQPPKHSNPTVSSAITKGPGGEGANTTQPPPPTQTVTSPDTSSTIPAAIVGSIFLLGLGTVLVYEGSRKKSFVPTFLGSTMLLVGMTPTINATFKISDIFKLEKLELTLPKPEKLTLHSRVERIGRIQNFSPGCADLAGKLCLEKKDRLAPQALEYLEAGSTLTPPEKLWEALCKIKSPVLITGRADRARLASGLLTQYESNIGLAQARAESVKSEILKRCNSGTDNPSLITQVGGPIKTQGIESKKSKPSTYLGDKEDRSVELDAILESIGPGAQATPAEMPPWVWPLSVLLLVLGVLACILALAYWLAKRVSKISISGDEKCLKFNAETASDPKPQKDEGDNKGD